MQKAELLCLLHRTAELYIHNIEFLNEFLPVRKEKGHWTPKTAEEGATWLVGDGTGLKDQIFALITIIQFNSILIHLCSNATAQRHISKSAQIKKRNKKTHKQNTNQDNLCNNKF
jgi:hypothetical protein